MALPKKLKNLNLFGDGENWIGRAEEYTPAKLSRKTEKYRGGGMPGSVDLDMGLADEALVTNFTLGGYESQLVKQLAATKIDGVTLRFAGSFQRDDTGEVSSVEIIQRGRYTELDRGTYKVGDNSQTKATMSCTYYKEVIDGSTIIEIDLVNMIYFVNGVDLMTAHKKAIGL